MTSHVSDGADGRDGGAPSGVHDGEAISVAIVGSTSAAGNPSALLDGADRVAAVTVEGPDRVLERHEAVDCVVCASDGSVDESSDGGVRESRDGWVRESRDGWVRESSDDGVRESSDDRVQKRGDDGVEDRADERDDGRRDGAQSVSTWLDLLERLREREPSLPFVLFSAAPTAETVDRLLAAGWTDLVAAGPAGAAARLQHRVASLVDHRRRATAGRRALAALETVGDAIAVVGADGRLELANRRFARRFGYGVDEVTGEPWQTLFTDCAVERVERDALAAVADDWEWIGRCDARLRDGDVRPVQVTVASAPAGGFLLVVDRGDEEN